MSTTQCPVPNYPIVSGDNVQWRCMAFDPENSNFFVAANSLNGDFDSPAFLMYDQYGDLLWSKTVKENGQSTLILEFSCFISELRQISIVLMEEVTRYLFVLKLSIDGEKLILKGWGSSDLK